MAKAERIYNAKGHPTGCNIERSHGGSCQQSHEDEGEQPEQPRPHSEVASRKDEESLDVRQETYDGEAGRPATGSDNQEEVQQDTIDGQRLSQHIDNLPILNSDEGPTKVYSAFDGKGMIREIQAGKSHIMLLNESGELYSYSYGEYGVMGRGKAVHSHVPMRVNMLAEYRNGLYKSVRVVKVRCGYQHCLALNSLGDVFAWGRGFEGQLGLQLAPAKGPAAYEPSISNKNSNHSQSQMDPSSPNRRGLGGRKEVAPRQPVQIECCSFPRVLRFFTKLRLDRVIKEEGQSDPINYKNQIFPDRTVADIECGAYHSLALTMTGDLYGWGYGSCGQLGIGRVPKVWIPTHIRIKEQVVQVAAGYAHTACITREGFCYTFGMNNKYQLGFDDQRARFSPERLLVDDNGLEVEKLVKIGSGDYNCFGLTITGQVYAWGSGVLGLKEITTLTRPKLIRPVIGDRQITDLYVNTGNAIFFTPVKIFSMKPNCGPSTGGTVFSIIGVGLCDMQGRQRIRFVYGHEDQFRLEVGLRYDENTNSYYSQTPNFEAESIYDPTQWPVKAKVSVTLDGNTWFDSESRFLVYSSKMKISNINPKFASVEGGLEMCVELYTDSKTMREFKNVSIGFQATVPDVRTDAQKVKEKEEEEGKANQGEAKALNPINLPLNSPELEKPDWVYFEGAVREKDVFFMVPPLVKLKSASLFYNIDISLNGQQFLGSPAFFRYYQVQVDRIEPDTTVKQGGTRVTVFGRGFIDSSQKKLRLSNSRTERLIDVKWDKDKEQYFFYTPPVTWLSGKEDDLSDAELDEITQEPVSVFLTISGKDWISLGSYQYYEPKLKQLWPGPTPDKHTTEEAIKENWLKEEPITNPMEGLTEKEADKKRVELEKKHKEELADIENNFRKPGSYIYIEGENFAKKEPIIARFVCRGTTIDSKAVYKNQNRIGVQVPLIEGPSEGVQDVAVHLSFNGGQDFGQKGLRFKYFCFNKETPEAERAKLMDAELKLSKKAKK